MLKDFIASLYSLIQHLNQKLPGARIVYADDFNPAIDLITDHTRYGVVATIDVEACKDVNIAICFSPLEDAVVRKFVYLLGMDSMEDIGHHGDAMNNRVRHTILDLKWKQDY